MKIAVPTNDRMNVANHICTCKEYIIYEVVDFNVKNINYRLNVFDIYSPEFILQDCIDEISEILHDIDLVFLSKESKEFVDQFSRNNITFKIKNETKIDNILATFLEKEKLNHDILSIKYPASKYTLDELGILRNLEFFSNRVKITFAMPLSESSYCDSCINSVRKVVLSQGYSFEFSTVQMNDDDARLFINREAY